jgi:8-oxo-dGTP pyrophosphatase MutT (NUDIX family)
VKAHILARLEDSRPAGDPAAAALAGLPPGVASALFPKPLVPAAVLVPLVEAPAGISILLTRRTDHLRDHPGQISFPGGRMESGDSGPAETALREAREEIGLRPDFVAIAGYLVPHAVVTGFAVSPVVAFLRAGFSLQPDPFEVAEIFQVPLTFLLDPRNLQVAERTVRGVTLPTCAWQYGEHLIWGATAQMLQTFCNILNETNR